MGYVPKTLAFLLLVTVVATALPVQGTAAAPAPAARMGGCHEPVPPTPAPQRASYLCCLAGHRSAILQQAMVSRLALTHFGQTAEFTQPVAAVLDRSPERPNPYGDSPGIAPLRI
ncbi:MAG: hypothetical protein LAN63_02760 [Acidobacteriia bacterium]|nr:hypothetical protein [Terriglobia bacterium]